MAAYLGYTLRMRTLFRGWPIMVNDTHTRRRRLCCHYRRMVIMAVSLKTPDRTSYWLSIETITLNCLVFEEIAFYVTDKWTAPTRKATIAIANGGLIISQFNVNLAIMIGPTTGKNCLTFGDDPSFRCGFRITFQLFSTLQNNVF